MMRCIASGFRKVLVITLIGFMLPIASAAAADVASLYGRTLKCSGHAVGGAELYISEDGLFLYLFGTNDKGIRFSYGRDRNESMGKNATYKSQAVRRQTEIVYEYTLAQKKDRRTEHYNQKGEIFFEKDAWRLKQSSWGTAVTLHSGTMVCELFQGHAISPPHGCDNPNFSMADMRECEGRAREAVARQLKTKACSEKVCIYRLTIAKTEQKGGGYEATIYSGEGYQFIDGEGLQGNEMLPFGARVVDPQGRTTIVGNSGGTCCGNFYEYVSGPLQGVGVEFTMLRGKRGVILTVPR